MINKRWGYCITFLVVGLMVASLALACSGSSDAEPTASQAPSPQGDQPAPVVATALPQPTRPETLAEMPAAPIPTPFPIVAPTMVPAAVQAGPAGAQAAPPLESGGGFYFGADAKWPDYVPADIPVLEGEIDVLMEAPGSHIRMLYKNISEEQIFQYAAVLEREGFNVTGIVYTAPGFPDRSEEKLARGEFDALDITRGAYRMRLEYGAGEASYDIYTAAFLEAPVRPTPTVVDVQWPDDAAAMAPPPQNCPLTALVQLNPSGYRITCARAGENVVDDYVNVLESLGFAEQDRLVNDRGELVELTMAKGSETLKLSPVFTGDLYIKIRPNIKWPASIAHLAPPPERCTLISAHELQTGSTHMSCTREGDGVIDDYVAALTALAYTEQTRQKNETGELTLLKLVRDDATVTIWPGPAGDLAIEIKPSSP